MVYGGHSGSGYSHRVYDCLFDSQGPVLITAFVLLTLLKAFYIVGEFMHLKGEVKTLIWSILIPTVFIAWLILALIAEGSSVFELRF